MSRSVKFNGRNRGKINKTKKYFLSGRGSYIKKNSLAENDFPDTFKTSLIQLNQHAKSTPSIKWPLLEPVIQF